MKSSHVLLTGALLSAAVGAAAGPASAAGELVSRATGADGAPFTRAQLATATRDGRFVLFYGPYSEAASAEPSDQLTLFVRDRETDTTTPVLRADGELGAVWPTTLAYDAPWTARDISSDGTKVLFAGQKPGGAEGTALYVRDLTAKTTTVVSTLPSGEPAFKLSGAARFIDGGEGVLYGTVSADGAKDTYTRTLPGGAAVLHTAGLAAISATADGKTITWQRPLLAAKRPPSTLSGAGWPAERAGSAVGYTVKGQAPVVVQRTTWRETPAGPGTYCYRVDPTTFTSDPVTLEINDTGTLLHQRRSSRGSNYPYVGTGSYERQAEGQWPASPRVSQGDAGSRFIGLQNLDFGERGETFLTSRFTAFYGYTAPLLEINGVNQLPDLGTWDRPRGVTGARLFAGDTGAVVGVQEQAEGTADVTQGIYAYDPVVPAPAVVSTVPARAENEITDDPSLTADVPEWASCSPVKPGPASAYVATKFNTPFTSTKSAGTVTTLPRDRRDVGAFTTSGATKTTLTIKTLGWTTWTKTLTGSDAPPATATLPKPWLFLPQTLRIDIEQESVNGAPAKHVIQTRSWQALK